MKQKIHVIGSGVIGLTTAITLLEENFDVHILTDKLVHDTVSAKAAAIWFPFKIEPREKVNEWSRQSYQKFQELASDLESGVSMVDFLVLIKEEKDAWWKVAIPGNAIRKATKEELSLKNTLAYVVNVPLIETPIYLDYLLNIFHQKGGTIEQKKVNKIEDIVPKETLIINCTGMGAADLVNDNLMYPIRGQIIKIDTQKGIRGFAEDYVSGENLNELSYMIPRSDCIILGGTTDVGKTNLEPNQAITTRIINGCRELNKNLKPVSIQSVVVGLRPGRDEVRLEKQGNVIHNYGHGGGGYTVSWGCANTILRIVKAHKLKKT